MTTTGQPVISRLPDSFRWPGGKRVAVIFNIAFEAWSDGQAPGIGAMGNVLRPGFFDTNAHSWASAVALVKAEKIRPLAVTSAQRVSTMPDVPTVAELGFPGFNFATWVGVFAPANTPAGITAE